MKTHEVAKLAGVSVRTLRHYDAVGLLCPRRPAENGYREYSEKDLDRLQQILFFKECGFSLEKIRALLADPSFDRGQAFLLQKKYLLHEKERIEAMLKTLERSIQSMKGEITMSSAEKFQGFDFSHNPYEQEARRLWGDTAVEESGASLAALSSREKETLAQSMESLFRELAALRGRDPASGPVQEAMEKMYRFFNGHFGRIYTPEVFAGLGKMYVEDGRFTKNIDRYGEGLAAFLSTAMALYARRAKSSE